MLNLKIDKNIQTPKTKNNMDEIRKIGKQMKTGDSVYFNNEKIRSASYYACQLRAYIKKHGGCGLSKTVDGGYRVWKIE